VPEDSHATQDDSAADSSTAKSSTAGSSTAGSSTAGSSTAGSSAAAEEYSNGNGHDTAYNYSRDDSSYSYGPDRSFSSRGPFEESAKAPFEDLPGASYKSSPAPLPPADELAAGGGFGGNDPASGFDASAGTSLADSEFGHNPVGTEFSNGGYSSGRTGSDSGSGHGSSSYSGSHVGSGPDASALPDSGPASSGPASSGMAGGGMAGGGFADGGFANSGFATGEAAAPPYTATFPAVAPAPPPGPQVNTPPLGSQAQHTGLYSYTPPEAKSRRGSNGSARRANLVIARLEPWSVMKFSFLMSLVAWIVLFVAVALLYYALSSLGVFESLQKTLGSVTSSQGSNGVNLSKWTSATRVLGYTMLIGAVDVVLITALSTVGAVVYNLVTHLGGGIEITLKETE
jgi:Flp pilus assembly pilin Flp